MTCLLRNLLLLGLLLPATALAATPQGEVTVRADQATFRQQEGLGIYQGNAELNQGDRQVNADRIELRLNNGTLSRVEATGSPVRLREGASLDASGQVLVYDVAAQTITLTGDAYIRHEGRTFEGARVVYDLGSRNVEASGDGEGQRVRLVIPAAEADSNIAAPQE